MKPKATSVYQEDARRRQKRRLDKLRLIDEAATDEDVAALRALACSSGGLIDNAMRKRVWPLLAGALGPESEPQSESEAGAKSLPEHRDAVQIQRDVDRSFVSNPYRGGLNLRSGERRVLRESLFEVLNRTLIRCEDAFYYQGMHDVMAILIVVCGADTAVRLGESLCDYHLHYATRATFEHVIQNLEIVLPLIDCLDAEVSNFILEAGAQPHFCLSWVLTWFAHVCSVDMACRLFDFFFASHPLMPFYVTAAAVVQKKDALLAMPPDSSEIHHFLSQFTLSELHLEAALHAARQLMATMPPSQLSAKYHVHPVPIPAHSRHGHGLHGLSFWERVGARYRKPKSADVSEKEKESESDRVRHQKSSSSSSSGGGGGGAEVRRTSAWVAAAGVGVMAVAVSAVALAGQAFSME